MKNIIQTIIRFPEIELRTRDAHKLRGYFGELFREQSPLLHNHYDSGKLRYKYPLVQYKVLDNTPTLVAFENGARLLTDLFLSIREIQIDDQHYPVHTKNIEQRKVDIGYAEELFNYTFSTLWMALNQQNYQNYRKMTARDRHRFLNRILVGNVLSFFKNMDLRLEPHQRLMAKADLNEKSTNFKDNKMIAFEGNFVLNAILPDHTGIGKAVSRGFGDLYSI